MAGNKDLGKAAMAKKDEFYTQLSDIEKELHYYRKHFKDKVVLCNCDDPFESNFFKYFVLNFNHLRLKKLIATSYVESPVAGSQLQYKMDGGVQTAILFGDEIEQEERETFSKHPYKAVVTSVHDATGNGGIVMEDIAELFKQGENELTELEGDGDFRSDECLALLDEADIVVTNPPFSLFREYVAVLMEHDKKFIIIGNQNAITYKEFFPLIKENKVWLGYGFPGNVGFFESPYEDRARSSQHKEGMIRVSGVMWYTNLDIKKRHEEMILFKRYDPEVYPKYDNYDAINVDVTAHIPCDYAGVMGVPITFMDKYSPDQFEIVGTDSPYYVEELGIRKIGKQWIENYRDDGGTGHITENMHSLVYYDFNGKACSVYKRILIRNKHPEQPKETR